MLPMAGCSEDACLLTGMEAARGHEAEEAELSRARPAHRAGRSWAASAPLGHGGLLRTGLSPTRLTSRGYH